MHLLRKSASKHGETIKKLTIESDSPPLSLKIDRNKTELHRGGSVSTIAPYAQIQTLLKSKRRPVLFALFNPIGLFLAVGLMVLVLKFLINPAWPQWAAIPIALPSALLLATIFILMSKNLEGGLSKIVLINRHEEQSFLKRNKDAVIVGTISAIVSSGLSFLVAYLLFRSGIK